LGEGSVQGLVQVWVPELVQGLALEWVPLLVLVWDQE
jgi:hypothetical protein